MTDTTDIAAAANDAPRVYDRRSLTYSNTFDEPVKRNAIRALEWMTGKPTVMRRIREFERKGTFHGQAFWRPTGSWRPCGRGCCCMRSYTR